MIEQLLIKKTLKAGDTIWEEGRVINSPLPEILLEEVRLGTDTVKVLKESDNGSSSEKLVIVAKKVEEKEVKLTSTSKVQTVSENKKPKPKLKRRKR